MSRSETLYAVPDPSTPEAAGGGVSRFASVWSAAGRESVVSFHRLEAGDFFSLAEGTGEPVLNRYGARWFRALKRAERDARGVWCVLVCPTSDPTDSRPKPARRRGAP